MQAVIKSIIISNLSRTHVRDAINEPLYFPVIELDSRAIKIPAKQYTVYSIQHRVYCNNDG